LPHVLRRALAFGVALDFASRSIVPSLRRPLR
jgi:hypothetical protein